MVSHTVVCMVLYTIVRHTWFWYTIVCMVSYTITG